MAANLGILVPGARLDRWAGLELHLHQLAGGHLTGAERTAAELAYQGGCLAVFFRRRFGFAGQRRWGAKPSREQRRQQQGAEGEVT